MVDGQMRAAGERDDDYATMQERLEYWIGRCRDILDAAKSREESNG